MSSSGSVGATIAKIIVTHYSKKVSKSNNRGTLRYGPGIFLLFLLCVIIIVISLLTYFLGHMTLNEFYGFLSFFGLGGIYCFGEYFKVKGIFNKKWIDFHSPWTGQKRESWSDLISVEFVSGAGWYLLVFKSGKKIRISNLITGHGDVIKLVKHKAINF
jgi:hypothetical protein